MIILRKFDNSVKIESFKLKLLIIQLLSRTYRIILAKSNNYNIPIKIKLGGKCKNILLFT